MKKKYASLNEQNFNQKRSSYFLYYITRIRKTVLRKNKKKIIFEKKNREQSSLYFEFKDERNKAQIIEPKGKI